MAGSGWSGRRQARGRDGGLPVIGIVLLVAIAVILSTVVGAMALGTGSSVDEQVRAAVDVSCDAADDALAVQLVDERGADHVNVTVASGDVEAVGRLERTGGRLEIWAGRSASSAGAARVYAGGQWDESGVGGGGGAGVGGGGGPGGGGGGGGGGSVPMAAAPAPGDTVSVAVVASTGGASTTVATESCDL